VSDFLKQFSDENYNAEEFSEVLNGPTGLDDRDPLSSGEEVDRTAENASKILADLVPDDPEVLRDDFPLLEMDAGGESLREDRLAEEEFPQEEAPQEDSLPDEHFLQDDYLQEESTSEGAFREEEQDTIVYPVIREEPQEITQAPKNPRQKIASAAHEVKKDKNYDKKKLTKYAAIAFSVLALSALAFGIFFITNQVQVRDFVGVQVTEARTWGIQNRITIEVREEYSLEADSGIVLAQNREANSNISRGSVLVLEVSKGPDMNEVIELPDFESMTTQEVREWRQEIQALNVNINEEYSDDIDRGEFIRLEFTSQDVTEENYTRADGLLIYMSRGKQVFEANIVVPNFRDEPLSRAQEWAREHGIELKTEEAPHTSIEAGNITGQSVDAGQRVARESELTITLSQGPATTVPNFANISSELALEIPNLEVTVQRRYSTSVSFGGLISQSVNAGTELVGENKAVTVVYSLGRPYIDNLLGESESVLAEYFYNFTSQGANISYQIFYVDGYEPKGSIVRMSRYAQFLGMNDHVRIDVSRGNRTPPVVLEADGE